MTVGDRIRQLRQARGLTQDGLGVLVHVDGRQISRYENGKVKPTGKILRRFADAFGVELEEILPAPTSQPAAAFQDIELYRQFLEVDRLDDEDRYLAKRMLQALVMKKQLQDLLASHSRQTA